MNRVLGAVTFGVLALSFVWPTHELGDTAVYGKGFLWGESSMRVNAGGRIIWFVDRWEIAQQALYGVAAVACVFTVANNSARALRIVAMAFAWLVALAVQRSVAGDGVVLVNWFPVVVAWTLVISVVSVLRYRSGR